MSTLLLITHQYPMAQGDGCFVQNELPTLARHYDRVWLCPLQNLPAVPRLPLPANVTLLPGPRLNNRVSLVWRGLFNRSALAPCWQLWQADRRHIRHLSHLKTFVLACLQGRALAAALPGCLKQGANGSVDVYAYWGAGAAYALPWLARLPLRQYIRLHGFDLYPERQQGYLPFRQALYARADGLLAISEHGQQCLRRQLAVWNLNPAKIMLNKLGTLPPPPRSETVRPDPEHIILVSCSSVIGLKRVALIYAAIADFARRHAGSGTVYWHHFGGGPLLSPLQAQVAADCPANLQVHLHGQTPQPDILAFYRQQPVAALLNLSSSEGIPVSIMEAISCDIPVLATDVGGTAEIVGHRQRTGRLVAADSPAPAVADALQQLLAERHHLQPAAFWRAEHHAETNAQRLAQHCLHRPPKPEHDTR